MQEMLDNEIYEKIREKVFFFVTYQRRTEAEVRRAFSPLFEKYNISKEISDDLIEELKEKGYIDDREFIKRKFGAHINFKMSSVKEIEYKILKKGISKDLVNEFLEENKERLYEHEVNAAKRLYEKKITEKSDAEVKQFLRRKGFLEDVINQLWFIKKNMVNIYNYNIIWYSIN